MPVWRLTTDGVLSVGAERAVIGDWLPAAAVEGTRGHAHLLVAPEPVGIVAPVGAPTLSLLDVGAWIDDDAVRLRNGAGTLDGVLELAGPGGTLGTTPGAHAEPLLTIAMALTLGRLGRALVHAAAVVGPDGRAWLLVGDTHAGKSTTTATLARAGWGWLADDQVILWEEGGALKVEGWARTPNLDAGYLQGQVQGRRVPGTMARPATAGPVPFGGLLLPVVDGDASTAHHAASASDAFAALVRQSPWLLADPTAAPLLHRVLHLAAEQPAKHLALGRDTYALPQALDVVLRHAIEVRT